MKATGIFFCLPVMRQAELHVSAEMTFESLWWRSDSKLDVPTMCKLYGKRVVAEFDLDSKELFEVKEER